MTTSTLPWIFYTQPEETKAEGEEGAGERRDRPEHEQSLCLAPRRRKMSRRLRVNRKCCERKVCGALRWLLAAYP